MKNTLIPSKINAAHSSAAEGSGNGADFEQRWAASVSADEFLQKMYNHIDSWQWTKQ